MATASISEYLIKGKEEMVGSKLPSVGDILSYFLFYTEKYLHKKVNRDVAKLTVEKAFEFYDKVEIPTHSNAVDKVLKLYEKYKGLKQNRYLKSALQKKREDDFIATFDDLFDLSDPNAVNSLKKKPLVRDFLIKQQQKGRPGTMDSILAQKQRSTGSTHDPQQGTSITSEASFAEIDVQSVTGSLNSISVDDTKEDPDFVLQTSNEDSQSPAPPMRRKTKKKELIGERVVGAIDKCIISSRCVVHLTVALLLELELNPKDYKISKSTIEKRRATKRESIFDQIKDKIEVSRGAVVHFDGKLMSAITGNGKVDRLAVKVTYKDVDQLLGVPISDGTGLEIAVAVFKCLEDWKLLDCIDACCFDTTGTNTGVDNGAAVFLEHFLGRNLLYLPCRHHIFELILRLVFETKVTTAATTSPTVTLFDRFKREWGSIDQSKYESGITDCEVNEHLRGIIKPTILFIEEQMKLEREKKTLRADYYELLELALMFLGGKLQKKQNQVIFHPAGPTHHARWMAKTLYSFKIFLFRKQFKLTATELRGLGAVNVFVIRFYLKLWFQSTKAYCAARLDLQLIQDTIRYTKIDPVMSKLVLQKFSRHLWYLSEEAVGMAFFDDNISGTIRRKMVRNLRLKEQNSSEETSTDSSKAETSTESDSKIQDDITDEPEPSTSEFEFREEDEFSCDNESDEDEDIDDSNVSSRAGEQFEEFPHKLIVDVEELMRDFIVKDISDFVTKRTFQFFRRFEIPTTFLDKDPSLWSSDEAYKKGFEIVSKLKVVNDTAERGVQLMSTYNQMLTKNEREKQFILQVVEHYRKKYKSANIKDLTKK